MSCTYTIPSSFLCKDEILEVRFLDEENRLKWYKGTVIHVDHYGYDEDGPYVECEMMYEDDEHVPDTRFYDKDFNDTDNLNAWRFASNLTKLLENIDNVHKEVESLKERLDLLEDWNESEEEDSDNEDSDDEDSDDEDSDDEEDTYDVEGKEQHMKKQNSWMNTVMFGIACVFSSHLVLKYFEYLDFKGKNDPMRPAFAL